MIFYHFFSLHNSLMVPVALQRIFSVLDHQNEVLGMSTIVSKTLPMKITSITLFLCSFFGTGTLARSFKAPKLSQNGLKYNSKLSYKPLQLYFSRLTLEMVRKWRFIEYSSTNTEYFAPFWPTYSCHMGSWLQIS